MQCASLILAYRCRPQRTTIVKLRLELQVPQVLLRIPVADNPQHSSVSVALKCFILYKISATTLMQFLRIVPFTALGDTMCIQNSRTKITSSLNPK